MKYVHREWLDCDPQDETGMCLRVEKASNGKMSAIIRVCGYVEVDGVPYTYDKEIRVPLKKDKG